MCFVNLSFSGWGEGTVSGWGEGTVMLRNTYVHIYLGFDNKRIRSFENKSSISSNSLVCKYFSRKIHPLCHCSYFLKAR